MKKVIFFFFTSAMNIVIAQNPGMPNGSVPVGEIEIRLLPGFIIKTNGDSINGLITCMLAEGRHIYYFKDNQTTRGEKFKAKDVKYFKLDDGRKFSVQTTKAIGDTASEEIYEVLTPNNKKMNLYRQFYHKGIIGTTIINDMAQGSYSYFISIDGKLKFIATVDGKILRPFNEKVSDLLSDCPELSKKIKEKIKGYKMSLLMPEQIVWKRVADEYEQCK